MKNNMVRAISQNGGIVMCALNSTEIVNTAEQIHKTSAVATAALGRLLTAASLMGSFLKNEEDSLTLRVEGDGPLGKIVCISDGEANVRGYVQNPLVDIDFRADGKLDVGKAVGKNGTLSIVRSLGLKEPYVGQVPLVSGEIAEDISSYYANSEQTPTVCALGVLVNPDLSVSCAGGFLIQLLPGASEEEISLLEKNLANMPSVTELLHSGKNQHDMVNIMLDGFEPDILDESFVEYKCHCSRQKTRDMLYALSRKDIEELAEEDAKINVECHFCAKEYDFDLNEMLQEQKQA